MTQEAAPELGAARGRSDAQRLAPRPGARGVLLFLSALCIVYVVASAPRVREYRAWVDAPETHFAGDVPVASADSYLWFRLARMLRADDVAPSRDTRRYYPEGSHYAGRPPLVRAMVFVADALDTTVYRAGLLLMVALAGLFVFPLGLYLYRLGEPIVGLYAGLVGALSTAFVSRTFPYRVDTDAGNAFFSWLIAACAISIDPRRSRSSAIAYAAATGLALRGFGAWYGKPGLLLLFVFCVAIHLAIARFGWRWKALLFGIVLLLANPLQLLEGPQNLIKTVRFYAPRNLVSSAAPAAKTLAFPVAADEMSEVRAISFDDVFATQLEPPILSVLGLAAFVGFAVRRPRSLIPCAPILALGASGLLISERFLMYLGPFVGIGLGWAVTRIAGLLAQRLPVGAAARTGTALGLSVALLVALVPATGFDRASRPGLDVGLIQSLRLLGAAAREGAVVAHPWDRGYLITDVTGLATLNDGSSPRPRVEQLLDRGLASPAPRALHAILRFLVDRGQPGIGEAVAGASDYGEVLGRIGQTVTSPDAPIYVLLSRDTARKFTSVHRKAFWDFDAGTGPRDGYDFRSCTPESEGQLICEKQDRASLVLDIDAGTLDGRPVIARFVRVRDGAVVEEREWPQRGAVVQLVENAGGPPHEVHVLSPAIYRSNFNQMFVLGRFDSGLFRLTVDDFPSARAYEVLATDGS